MNQPKDLVASVGHNLYVMKDEAQTAVFKDPVRTAL